MECIEDWVLRGMGCVSTGSSNPSVQAVVRQKLQRSSAVYVRVLRVSVLELYTEEVSGSVARFHCSVHEFSVSRHSHIPKAQRNVAAIQNGQVGGQVGQEGSLRAIGMERGLRRVAVKLRKEVALLVAASTSRALAVDAVVEIPEVEAERSIVQQVLQNPFVKVYEHAVPRREVPVEVNVNGEIGCAILDESATSVSAVNGVLLIK
ncbi:hypothetical protein Mapa_003813 [Marchantia paleacea]|nr:hypothetical protein Mapa_003813 [Marchantia paleacea]